MTIGSGRLLRLLVWCAARGLTPRQSWLAGKLGCAVRTVQDHMAELRKAGLIACENRRRGGSLWLPVEKAVEKWKASRGISVAYPWDNPWHNSEAPIRNARAGASSEYSSTLTQQARAREARSATLPQRTPETPAKKPARREFVMPSPMDSTGTRFNPEYGRVRDFREELRRRAARARNPKAYERAVLLREFPQYFVSARPEAPAAPVRQSTPIHLEETPQRAPVAQDGPSERKPAQMETGWRDSFLSGVDSAAKRLG